MISQDAIGDNEKKLKSAGLECEICQLEFSDSFNKERHIKTVHESKKPYSSTKIHETISHLPESESNMVVENEKDLSEQQEVAVPNYQNSLKRPL